MACKVWKNEDGHWKQATQVWQNVAGVWKKGTLWMHRDGGFKSCPTTVACTPLPSAASKFVKEYVSSGEKAAEARDRNGLFPRGPNLTLGYFGPDYKADPGGPNSKTFIVENGLTLVGPNYGSGETSPASWTYSLTGWARQHDKKIMHHIRPVSQNSGSGIQQQKKWNDLVAKMGSSAGRATVKARIDERIKYQVAHNSDVIAGWYFGPDDGPAESYSGGQYFPFMQMCRQAVIDHDPLKRPFTAALGTDTNTNVVKRLIQDGMPLMMPELYFIKDMVMTYAWELGGLCHTTPPGSPNTDIGRTKYRHACQYMVKLNLDELKKHAQYTLPAGNHGTIVPLLSDYVDPYITDGSGSISLAEVKKFCIHDFWAMLIAGAGGIIIYAYSLILSGSTTTRHQMLEYLRQFKILTDGRADNNLGRALLWGQNKTDLTFNITNGAKTTAPMTWAKGSPNFDCNVKTWWVRNIQHLGTRYIVMVNSHPTNSVHVTISGFPTSGLKITDMHTGVSKKITSASKTEVLGVSTVKLYKIEADDGYCGGGGTPGIPQPTPVITQQPHSVSLHIGDHMPTFHVNYTPADATVQWQWRNLVTGVNWQNIPGEVSKSYTMVDRGNGVIAGQNGDEFRAAVTSFGHSTIHSHTAKLTILAGTAKPHVGTPANKSAVVGHSVTFTANVSGAEHIIWQYSANHSTWHDIVGPHTNSYTIRSVLQSQNHYWYRIMATNANGARIGGHGVLTVTAVVVKPTVTGPANASVDVGKVAVFRVVAHHYTNLQWEWKNSGTWRNLPSVTATHHTQAVRTSMNGYEYRCKVTGPGGVIYSRTAVLTVTQAVIPPPVISQVADIRVKMNTDFRFVAHVVGATSYQWRWRSATGTYAYWTGRTGLIATGHVSNSGMDGNIYSLRATGPGGVTDSNPARLTIV